MLTRCAVLGKPIGHSLSPVMHRAAYAHLGLSDWTYEAVEVDEDELAGFLAGPPWRGLSLTMPLKKVGLALADEVSDRAAAVGALNTLVFADDGASFGDNTDIPGAVGALREAGVDRVGSATIIGAGATAMSLTAAMQELGLADLTIVVRDPSRAEELARFAAVRVAVCVLGAPTPAVDLLVSTVPTAAVADDAAVLVGSARAVFDAIYDPWPTTLAAAALETGVPVVSGLDLLAHQAALQVALMTGATVPVHILRDAALEAIASR